MIDSAEHDLGWRALRDGHTEEGGPERAFLAL